jgi:hypothetical protein
MNAIEIVSQDADPKGFPETFRVYLHCPKAFLEPSHPVFIKLSSGGAIM